ncbi:MAG: hypothetical protein R3C68_09685 [Myxococcota bacterium]
MSLERVIFVSAMVVLTGACQNQETSPSSQERQVAQPIVEKSPPKPMESPGSHPDCVGPVMENTPEVVKVGKTEWERSGSTLRMKANQGAGAQGALKIGAMADVKEDSPENRQNLQHFVQWFKREKVDVVVLAGDKGMTQEQLVNALDIVAGVGVPVFNIIGNREGRAAYRAAMAQVQKKHPHVFDLNQIRRVDLPGADLVSMPGYWDADHIHAEDGCHYDSTDVRKLATVVDSCDSPVVLISHGAHQQSGTEAIDLTSEGDHTGDPALTALIRDHKVPFGIFGNIHEAGGRGTDFEGNQHLKPGVFHTELYLNPGPVDGVRWEMNDGTESVGMAAILTIKGGKGSYQVQRIKDETKVKAAKGG